MALCYLAAFTFLGLTLSSGLHVGVAYGLWTAIGIVLVVVAARVIWNDHLSRRMLVGIGLIVIGVVLIGVASAAEVPISR
ncbi:DMT family transporter [Gulosibacter sediminis]|uniref:DMT family transporter n=1 Tax=Gulosibacter sediminis TaxID=1729695 RepID=UPI0024A845DF|nr:SMR family transporter [Gulosibacter sediminis]